MQACFISPITLNSDAVENFRTLLLQGLYTFVKREMLITYVRTVHRFGLNENIRHDKIMDDSP